MAGMKGKLRAKAIPQLVLQWFASNGRDFPWRSSIHPYNIFIAEILLRRTQAERVVESYLKLIERYLTPESLSHADIQELRRLFQPLGLVRRADQVVAAAKRIVDSYDGLIPNNLCDLSTLPCVGIYSARAIMCLSFGAVVPMIDESSGRLLQRVFNLQSRGPAYRDRQLLKIAETIIPAENARNFNLGLLDVASTYCHHNTPDCSKCPLAKICSYPLKRPKHIRKTLQKTDKINCTDVF